MARTLAFDRDEALDSAMHLFWRQGYSATSMQQLLDTMEISRSSLYATFGDKQRLFLEALDQFSDRNYDIIESAFTEEKPLNAVRSFFVETVHNSTRSRLTRGCMMVNTILELADVEPELSQHAIERLKQVEQKFEHCFQLAQKLDQLDKTFSPEYLAKMVMTLNQGLRVSSRKHTTREEMAKVVDTTMQLLGIEPSKPAQQNTTH